MDARKPSNISYPIRNWFSPDDLMAKLKHNVEEANEALTVSDDSYMTDSNGLNLRCPHLSWYGPESFVSEGDSWTDEYKLIPQGVSLELNKIIN